MATICKKPLHKEYARRTVCRDDANGWCSREWGCKFSHDLLEMGRLKGLLGDIEVLREPLEYLTLEYVGSFEAFGHHESWGEGWRMTVRARELHGLFNEISPPIVIEAENVNEVINKVEDELLWNGYSTGRAEHMGQKSKNTVCNAFHDNGSCNKGDRCRESHTLIDLSCIRRMVGSPGWYGTETFLVLQFIVEDGSRGPWKVSLHSRRARMTDGRPEGDLYRFPVPLVTMGGDLHACLRNLQQMESKPSPITPHGTDSAIPLPPQGLHKIQVAAQNSPPHFPVLTATDITEYGSAAEPWRAPSSSRATANSGLTRKPPVVQTPSSAAFVPQRSRVINNAPPARPTQTTTTIPTPRSIPPAATSPTPDGYNNRANAPVHTSTQTRYCLFTGAVAHPTHGAHAISAARPARTAPDVPNTTRAEGLQGNVRHTIQPANVRTQDVVIPKVEETEAGSRSGCWAGAASFVRFLFAWM